MRPETPVQAWVPERDLHCLSGAPDRHRPAKPVAQSKMGAGSGISLNPESMKASTCSRNGAPFPPPGSSFVDCYCDRAVTRYYDLKRVRITERLRDARIAKIS